MKTTTIHTAKDGRVFDKIGLCQAHEDSLFEAWLKDHPILGKVGEMLDGVKPNDSGVSDREDYWHLVRKAWDGLP